MKLVTGGVKHHLAAVERTFRAPTTLCGCVVTKPHNWKRISSLEGDECQRCAELAFGYSAKDVDARTELN